MILAIRYNTHFSDVSFFESAQSRIPWRYFNSRIRKKCQFEIQQSTGAGILISANVRQRRRVHEPAPAVSIFSWLALHSINDEYRHGTLQCFQLQTELLANRVEQG